MTYGILAHHWLTPMPARKKKTTQQKETQHKAPEHTDVTKMNKKGKHALLCKSASDKSHVRKN
jgi:hypothetical protein